MNNYLSKKIKILSFISILLVVFLHSYNLTIPFYTETEISVKSLNWYFQNFFTNGITRIAVPFFFIVSGFLFFLNNPTDYINKIKKRSKTLLLPYIIWSLAGILLYFILQTTPQSKPFFKTGLIKDFTPYQLLFRLFINPVPYQFWFIRDLIFFVLISPLIYFFIKKTKEIGVLLLLFCWLIDLDFMIISNESILFFYIGAIIAIRNQNIVNYDYSKFSLYLFNFWLFLVVITTSLKFIDFQSKIIITIIFKSSIIIGLLTYWSVYDLLFLKNQNTKFLKSPIFQFSFFIFAIHEPFLTIIKKILFSIFSKDAGLIIYIIAPLIVIFICILISFAFKKYFQNTYYLITGGR